MRLNKTVELFYSNNDTIAKISSNFISIFIGNFLWILSATSVIASEINEGQDKSQIASPESNGLSQITEVKNIKNGTAEVSNDFSPWLENL